MSAFSQLLKKLIDKLIMLLNGNLKGKIYFMTKKKEINQKLRAKQINN